jgi:hypothetical protein
MMRATGTVDQADDALRLEGPEPVVQGAATTAKLPTRHLDAGSLRKTDGSHSLANSIGRPCLGRPVDRPPTLAGWEQKIRPFLVMVAAYAAVRIGCVWHGHARTLTPALQYLSTNFT